MPLAFGRLMWLKRASEVILGPQVNSLGSRVRRLRTERNLSLEELATLSSVYRAKAIHYTTIGKIERGERQPSVDILDAVATALGVTINDLTGKTEGYLNEYQVPVIPIEKMGDWSAAMKISTTSCFVPNSHFALLITDYTTLSGVLADNVTLAISSSDGELRDQRLYAVLVDGKPTIQRFHHDSVSLEECWPQATGQREKLGQSTVRVIGRVIWISASV